jgi:geranylgeranyl pyrophosphate synthase
MIPERKELMITVRKRVQSELKSLINPLEINPILKEQLLSLFQKRTNSLGMRSSFVYIVAQYIQEQAEQESISLKKLPDEVFTTQLPFLAEGIIAVQYYENQVLDGKGGVYANGKFDMKRVNHNMLGSHFVKDLLYRYVEEKMFPNDCQAYRLTMRAATNIFSLVDLGQGVQENWGTYDSFLNCQERVRVSAEAEKIIDEEIINRYCKFIFQAGMSQNKAFYIQNYLRRIYMTSGILFQKMAELTMDLSEYNGRARKSILKFAVQYGMTGQIVNDINDFVPAECNIAPVAKIPDDAFADIRNNNITLPLAFFFNANPKWDIKRLQKIKSPEERLFLLKDAIYSAQQVALKSAQSFKKLVNSCNSKNILLLDMSSIVLIEKNRYYIELERYPRKIIKAFYSALFLNYNESKLFKSSKLRMRSKLAVFRQRAIKALASKPSIRNVKTTSLA